VILPPYKLYNLYFSPLAAQKRGFFLEKTCKLYKLYIPVFPAGWVSEPANFSTTTEK
jgi:hypothetical protein